MSNKSYNRPLEHKEYIKLKYLSQNDDKKTELKKKIKKKRLVPNKSKKIKIFDDDIDLKNIESKDSDDDLYYGTNEEKPIIAEVIDERPLHIRRKDIDTNRWKTVGFVGEEEVNKSETKRDLSPKHKNKSTSRRHDSDSDLSPQRPKIDSNPSRHRNTNRNDRHLNPRNTISKSNLRHDSDSDLSPQRPNKESDSSRHRNTNRDKRDLSPRNSSSKSKLRYDSDSDLSPQRPNRESDSSRHRNTNRDKLRKDSDSDMSPPRIKTETTLKDKKSELTLGGKTAGLSDAKVLREEIMSTKRKEQEMFKTISDEMSGKNAKTVFRDSKSGRIRDLEEEARLQHQKDLIKDKIDSEMKAKYDKWSKGLIQTQQKKDKIESDLHEMSKPLARYEGDEDLDQMLKEQEREEDPMLETIKMNKTKQQMKEGGIKVRPQYKGPPPPLNRFNIKPGYRWDGVDRSNGFEKKFFGRISAKESNLEEAYRWATEDM